MELEFLLLVQALEGTENPNSVLNVKARGGLSFIVRLVAPAYLFQNADSSNKAWS